MNINEFRVYCKAVPTPMNINEFRVYCKAVSTPMNINEFRVYCKAVPTSLKLKQNIGYKSISHHCTKASVLDHLLHVLTRCLSLTNSMYGNIIEHIVGSNNTKIIILRREPSRLLCSMLPKQNNHVQILSATISVNFDLGKILV